MKTKLSPLYTKAVLRGEHAETEQKAEEEERNGSCGATELKDGIYPEKTKIQKESCTTMFTAALFTIHRTWKQPKCP